MFNYDPIKPLFGGKLTQTQVDGIESILKATKSLPKNHRAYLLATVFHETNKTMKPIYEIGGKSYFNKYEPNTKIGKMLGNIKTGDGYMFRGRGYVQITGRHNYERASQELGINLIANPDLALDPNVAAEILVKGCTEGWFTGKKLSNYASYLDMRRVVNGLVS